MAILPLLCLPLLAVIFLKKNYSRRESILLAFLAWGGLLGLGTEILSLFNGITFAGVFLFWALVLGSLVYWARRDFASIKAWCVPPQLAAFEWALVGASIFVVAAIFLTAWISPPNNWDSMSYHLGRVAHWMQNQSLAHYPTHIQTQLWKSRWAEEAILHLQILLNGDRLANAVQFFSMLISGVAVSLIARYFQVSRAGQILAFLLTVTIPQVILQASSTQNDLTLGMWLSIMVYFILKIKDRFEWTTVGAIALGLSLSVYTKETAYIYALPFGIYFLFLLWSKYKINAMKVIAAGAICLVVLNFGHYARNAGLYGNLLGPGAVQSGFYKNPLDVPAFLTNLLLSMSLHLATPIEGLNRFWEEAVKFKASIMALDLQNPNANAGFPFYISKNPLHEDNSGNFIHLILLLASLTVFVARKQWKDKGLSSYVLCTLMMMVLFIAFLKWMPFHGRLHVPFFILIVPILVKMADGFPKQVMISVAAIAFFTSLPWVFANESRPWGGENSIFKLNRQEQYFQNKKGYVFSYQAAQEEIAKANCSQVGLIMSEDSWEYPLWVNSPKVRFEHVNVENKTARLKYPKGPFMPCMVVSDQTPDQGRLTVEGANYALLRKTAFINIYALDLSGELSKQALMNYMSQIIQHSQLAVQAKAQGATPEQLLALRQRQMQYAKLLASFPLAQISPQLSSAIETSLVPGLTRIIEGYETKQDSAIKEGEMLLNLWDKQVGQ